MRRAPIPITEDLAVLAKAAYNYHYDPDNPTKLAIVLLAQRVCLEKGARYMQRKKASFKYSDLQDVILKIISDPDYADRIRSLYMPGVQKLKKSWPAYMKSGLID